MDEDPPLTMEEASSRHHELSNVLFLVSLPARKIYPKKMRSCARAVLRPGMTPSPPAPHDIGIPLKITETTSTHGVLFSALSLVSLREIEVTIIYSIIKN